MKSKLGIFALLFAFFSFGFIGQSAAQSTALKSTAKITPRVPQKDAKHKITQFAEKQTEIDRALEKGAVPVVVGGKTYYKLPSPIQTPSKVKNVQGVSRVEAMRNRNAAANKKQ